MQPKPIPNDSQPIAEMVIADIRERMEQGHAKYGVELQAHNGRKALQDAYEEVLDLAQYIRQEMVERDALAGLVAELRGALEKISDQCRPETQGDTSEGMLLQTCILSLETAECALSLPLPAAAGNVAAMREKAELLDVALSSKNVREQIWWTFEDEGNCVPAPTAEAIIGILRKALTALRAARGER